MTDHAEYVSPGHPDRLADAIAEGIVTAAVRDQARELVGVEVALHRDRVFVDGRIVADLELLHVDWGERVLDGYFRDPPAAWER